MEKDSLNLLIKLCETQSSCTEDTDIMNYIKNHITKELSLEYTEDDYGNIYVTKGDGRNGYKTVVCHTDTVHKIYPYRKVYLDNGYLFAMGCADNNSVLSQVGIGGDDRVGIFVCLEALKDFDDIKAVFFRFEETGCKGSRKADMSFFDDSNFVIQADRKGYGDFIRNSKGIEMCSDTFVNDTEKIREKYGYKIVYGISTDVNQLKENGLKVSAINVGCGYYHPHSESEVIYVPNVIACYNMISEIFGQFGNNSYNHDYVKPTYVSNTRSIGTGSYLRGDSAFSFSNTSAKNFFNTRLIKDLFVPISKKGEDIIDMLSEDRFKDFWKLEGDRNIFYYTDTKPIFVNKTVVYNPLEDIFYNLKDNCFIVKPEEILKLKKDMRITDTSTEFVFSTYYDYWIIRNESKWSDNLDTWVLKDEL